MTSTYTAIFMHSNLYTFLAVYSILCLLITVVIPLFLIVKTMRLYSELTKTILGTQAGEKLINERPDDYVPPKGLSFGSAKEEE